MTNAAVTVSQLPISYILITKSIEKMFILSTDLEITIDYQTLTDGDAVLSAGTFLTWGTITEGDLQEKERKSLKFVAFQIFEKFECETISIV